MSGHSAEQKNNITDSTNGLCTPPTDGDNHVPNAEEHQPTRKLPTPPVHSEASSAAAPMLCQGRPGMSTMLNPIGIGQGYAPNLTHPTALSTLGGPSFAATTPVCGPNVAVTAQQLSRLQPVPVSTYTQAGVTGQGYAPNLTHPTTMCGPHVTAPSALGGPRFAATTPVCGPQLPRFQPIPVSTYTQAGVTGQGYAPNLTHPTTMYGPHVTALSTLGGPRFAATTPVCGPNVTVTAQQLPRLQPTPVSTHMQAGVTGSASHAVPITEIYPGRYGFSTSHEDLAIRASKGDPWKYSEMLRKIYVKPDVAFSVKFKTEVQPPPQSHIRITVMDKNTKDPVKRCPDHTVEIKTEDEKSTNHLMLCQHHETKYDIDEATGHEYLLIPHEHPHIGTSYVTNVFEFKCFSSCPGIRKRATQIVYTLENENNEMLGRDAIDVRVCASTKRDHKHDEERATSTTRPKPKRLKKEPRAKVNKKDSHTKEGGLRNVQHGHRFSIRGRKNYEFLLRLRNIMEVAHDMRQER